MFGVFSAVSRSECCVVLNDVIRKATLVLRVYESGCVHVGLRDLKLQR